MKSGLSILLIVILSAYSQFAFAGGVVARQQQIQELKKKQQQGGPTRRPQDALRQQSDQKNKLPSIRYEVESFQFSQIIDELEYSSEVWPKIIDKPIKMLIIDKFKNWYLEQGIKIGKPASHYADLIDDMSSNESNMLSNPFKEVIKFIAIIEYDFQNGQNPDQMIRTLLGEKGYQQNKVRLGME